MDTNKIEFSGTYRLQGSVGIPDTFKVSLETNKSPKEVMDYLRKGFYKDGYEHILFTTCKVNGQPMSMMVVLELE